MARRFPRRATAAVAAGLAVACVALTAAPALGDQVRSEQWWLSALHVTKAWESSKGSGVTVAVLDTGVAPAQADLTGSVITGPDYTASGRTASGPFWGIHGTAIASLIAGHGHGPQTADGIVGVARAAKILSVRVTLESNDPLLTDQAIAARLPGAIANGIRYAVGHGAGVIDLPLDPAALTGTTLGGSTAERSAVAYALSKHVVLVAPGGDGGTGAAINYPAAYPGVISVGAFSRSFTKAAFTIRRSYVTLTAAGDGVEAATLPSGYAMLHSTSAASAVVAGIVALIRAQFPTLTPAQVTSALTTSTVFRPRGGRLNGSGYGTADAQAALVAAARINAAVPANSGSGGAILAPTSPAVRAQGGTVWGMLRLIALILAGVLLLLLFAVVIYLRARRRRSRTTRLAPLREAGRVAVRAQPDFSAAPPPADSQFAGAQFAGSHSAGSHSARSHSTGAQSGRSPSGRSPSGGSQFAGGQFRGAPFQGARFEGAQTAQPPLPGDQGAQAPFPGDQMAMAPFPGDQATQAPFPGDPGALAPFPGDPGAPAPFPGDQATQAPFPGDPGALAPFPGDQGALAPFPGDQVARSPFPGDQVAETQMPGSQAPGTAAFPAAPSGNGAPGGAASAPARALPPTPRPSVVRPPQISGTPPWQPAEKPDGELPWASTPPPKSAQGRLAQPRRAITAGVQPWGPAADRGAATSGGSPGGTDPGGPAEDKPRSDTMVPDSTELGGRAPGSMPLPAPQTGRDDQADNGPGDDDGSKLYVWNPSEVTESFPALPPSEEPGPGRS